MSGSRCTLHAALGRVAGCTEAECPFWGDDACVLREVKFEILYCPPLAEHLLELRTTLEAAGPAATR